MGPGSPRAKRALDLTVAVPAAVLSLPVQAAVALAVRTTLGRPVLFRQTRPGRHGARSSSSSSARCSRPVPTGRVM